MAKINLLIDDVANRLTLRALLAAAGHRVVSEEPDIIVTDDREQAIRLCKQAPTLLLATASEIPNAVTAMREGVYGYLFVPFQPGEAELTIQHMLDAEHYKEGVEVYRPMTLEEADARHILQTLRYCKNNRARAARLLGIGRNTLWRKLKHQKAKPRQE
jgi:DNA-binding NtrC family response regulator